MARRTRLERANYKATTKLEEWMTAEVASILDEAREDIITEVDRALSEADVTAAVSGVDVTFLASLEERFSEYFDRIISLTVVAYALGSESAAKYLAGSSWDEYTTELDQLFSSSRAQEYMRRARNRLTGAASELWSDVRETLVDGIEQGLSAEDLARNVQQRFNESHGDVSRNRARTIARTETISAFNISQLEQTQALPDELKPTHKRWIATLDERTRPAHFEADGQTVPIDSPFLVGGEELMVPGDPSASGAESINCRCTYVELDIDDDGDGIPHPPSDSGRQYLSDERISEVISFFENQGVSRRAFQASGLPSLIAAVEEATFMPVAETAKFTVRAFQRDQRRHQLLHFGDSELTADAMSDVEVSIGSARIRAATLVSIPALIEARIELTGEADEDGFVSWSGVLAVEGKPTGDGRLLDHGSLRWEDLPLDLRWTKFDRGGHDDAVVVGRIDEITRVDNTIMASGVIDTTFAEGLSVAALIERGLAGGVSVDLDDIPADEVTWTEEAEVAAAGDDAESTLTISDDEFALIGDINLPVDPDREREWDGAEARRRVFEFATDDDGNVDESVVRRAFLWRDDDANPQTQGAYKLGFADVIDGELRIIARGVFATTGARGIDAIDLPADDIERIKTRIASLYEKLSEAFDDDSLVAPWLATDSDDYMAGLVEIEASAWSEFKKIETYPAHWFSEPTAEQLAQSNGLVASSDGRIYGWVAQNGVCHDGYNGRCVTIDNLGSIDLSQFLRNPIKLDNGDTTYAGVFTMNIFHDEDIVITDAYAAKKAQNENTRTVAGIITVGINEGGMWFSGAAAPWMSQWDRQVFEACRPSLHMKEQRGKWTLKAVLSVPVPGFPPAIAASAVIDRSNDVLLNLTRSETELAASGGFVVPFQTGGIDYKQLAAAIVDEMESRKRDAEEAEFARMAKIEELKRRMSAQPQNEQEKVAA